MALKKEKKKSGKKSGKTSQKASVSEGENLNVPQDTSGKKDEKSGDDYENAISEPSSSSHEGEESASGGSTVSQPKDTTSLTETKTSSSSDSKLERRASLRRKFGALIRGSAELPAAINRTLQPIKRSLSFSKDLNRVQEASKPHRATSVQWYNSLGSLAEDESADDPNARTDRKNVFKDVFVEFPARSQVTRTRSLIEKNFVASPRRRVSKFSSDTAPYGRYSDHYDSTIDLSNPPCEASSLPALTRTAIDEDYGEYELHGAEEQQVRNRWGNLRSSARNLSFLRLGQLDAKQHSRATLKAWNRSSRSIGIAYRYPKRYKDTGTTRRGIILCSTKSRRRERIKLEDFRLTGVPLSRRVEIPVNSDEEGLTTRKTGFCNLVRRLSSGGGAGRRAIGTCGRGRAIGPKSGGLAEGPTCGGGEDNSDPVSAHLVGQQAQLVGADNTTVSAPSGNPGRGILSRRSSRDLSPSKSSAGQDAATHGGGGGAGTTSGAGATGTGQDWLRLVGSIRRKVRRKTAHSSSSITEAALRETTRNQDDFLKATMRIFLVVSPPMGRVQVRSRSLTQLDALGSSMLDTGEHHLGGGPSQQQSHHLQHHHQPPQLQHHPQNVESSPRFLVPNAPSVDGAHQNRTRHKLSRSQVSSSEYFSVSFDVGDDTSAFDREEFLPAAKGTYLAEALSIACEKRGVDLSRVEVFDSFSTQLPILTTDTSCLGGKHLRVTAKDEKANTRSTNQRANQSVPLKKASGSYRGRSGRFFSVSTEDSSVDSEVSATTALPPGRSSAGAAALKASKQRWSGFFTNTKGTKLDLLTAQLDDYNKHGVPKLTDLQLHYELALNDDALYSLEEDWREIVQYSDQLSEKQQQQQTALWELAQTEVAYIKTLKVVTDLFMACLCSLQASNILNEVDRTKLFSNIPEIYAANRYFWTEHVLAMINASRSNRQPLDSGHLLHGFETFEQTFAPYTRYCSEQSRCQQYCRDRLNDNQLFTVYLVWCETQKDCNRLKLLDILVKPMQRLTKYSLLLKAVHKNTENEEQRAELTHMTKSVDDFVASVNAALKRSEETARLASAACRIDSYDVVESRDEELEKLIKIHSSFDITTAPIPGCPKDTLRILIREGDLKLRDAATSKMEVHVLLLTDMLLICKTSTKKTSSSGSTGASGGGLKIIRQPYVVDRIRIHELKEPSSLGLVYLNEYGAASSALVLSAGEQKLAKSWMESLRKAQQQFALMKVPPLGNTMNLGTVSRQPSTFLGDVDFEGEECEGIPKTPRGSSRASRVSSLAHSHSGSMEMEGVSPGSSSFLPSYNPSRNVSVETSEPPRASSVSSEEGGECSGHNHRPLQISPNKFDNRRFLLSKSPTPNTLSVQVPAYSSLGQSLPNLTLATSPQTSTVSPTPPNSLLIVPQITKSKDTLLSPGHRGISYPPPSPPRGALRRAFAIPQSRNPPLIKTRHVNTSVTAQPMMSLDTEAMDERRRRLEPSHRMPSTSSIAEEKK